MTNLADIIADVMASDEQEIHATIDTDGAVEIVPDPDITSIQ